MVYPLDTVTRPCTVTKVSSQTFRIILTQGLNRQIRRMRQYLSYNVVTLKGFELNIHLDLPIGDWRDLTEQELDVLNSLLADSSGNSSQNVRIEKTLSNQSRSYGLLDCFVDASKCNKNPNRAFFVVYVVCSS